MSNAPPRLPPDLSETGLLAGEAVWQDVLSAMDRTYSDLVTHHEQLERQNQELEELRSFHASVLASVSDALIVVSRRGTVMELSQSVADLTGRPAGAGAGLPVTALFVAADRARLDHAMAEVANHGRAETIEAGLETPSGPAPLELSLSPRFDERRRVAGWVMSGRPLGELRRANARLAQSLEELQSAQSLIVRNEKLASLGRLLAGVAHELNNPISFVYANAHALDRYATKLETYFARVEAGASREDLTALRGELRLERDIRNLREAVEGTRAGAERVRDIVEDLRRLSSDGAGETGVFDLAELAQVAAHWVLRGARTEVGLEIAGLSPLEVRGRRGHVQQVLMNLVQNAVDAMGPEGGRLRIVLAQAAGRGTVTVADSGPGVPPPIAQQIFDPFFTTKDVGQGTGLGLAISAKIIAEHGGRLVLLPGEGAGEGGAGAAFRFDLPLVSGPETGAETAMGDPG